MRAVKIAGTDSWRIYNPRYYIDEDDKKPRADNTDDEDDRKPSAK